MVGPTEAVETPPESRGTFDRRAVRTQCRKSLEWVGATSGTSGHTARLYELDPLAVTERSRAKLAPVYEQLAKFLSETLAP